MLPESDFANRFIWSSNTHSRRLVTMTALAADPAPDITQNNKTLSMHIKLSITTLPLETSPSGTLHNISKDMAQARKSY